ncbi:MAG: barstar family protein [Candidatus Acidiferrales bacterium]
MAAFTRQDRFGGRIDWNILRDGGVALYWRRDIFNEDVGWFLQQNYQVFSFDCARWASSQEMHADFRRTLSFPAYYGMNLDAFNDCLSDLAVPEAGGIALSFTQFEKYADGLGADLMVSGRPEAEVVINILANASRYFLLTGSRLLSLIQTNDVQTRYDKLGCISAQWNRREWANKDRGL